MVPFLDVEAMNAEVGLALDAAFRRIRASSTYVGGPEVERFEQLWAAYCGSSYAVGVANGTDALELALTALGIGLGDEVILPANTFVATAAAVVRVGATPRFVDVDPRTLLMTAETVGAGITNRTAAVIPVHLYGQMPDMDALLAVARRWHLAVVEDAAQAHGAGWRGRPAGSFGHAACFSFYPGKNLGALGDGGAVVTPDVALAARIRSFADHGRGGQSRYAHQLVGRNSRLDALQAAFLAAKLPHLESWSEARRRAVARYRHRLADSPVQLVEVAEPARPVHHLNVARVPDRDRVAALLRREDIQTGLHYPIPCHHQPPYAAYASGTLPVVETVAHQILTLPLSPHMTHGQIDRTCAVLLDATKESDVAA